MAPISRLGCALLVAVGVASCNSPMSTEEPAKTPAPSEAAAGTADATLTVVKWPQLERAIAAHKGKVVVLDVWAEY